MALQDELRDAKQSAKTHEAICQSLIEENKQLRAYFQAVDNALVCWEMTTTGNAKVDLNNLICMEQQVCIDPAVSLDARTLIRSGRIEAARDCIEVIKTAHPSCDRDVLIGAIKSAFGLEI